MYLMLKDIEVLYFNLEEFIIKPLRDELLPLCLRGKTYSNSNMKDILNSVQLVKSYLSRRVLSLSRTNAKQIYTLFQIPQLDDIDTRVKICIHCKGVSIQDSYWIKEDNSTEKFSDVNIRKNKFTEIVDIALNGVNPSVTVNSICPELTTHGIFRKAWIRQDGDLYLLKSDKHSQNINTRMEVLASKILGCFDNKIDCIEYTGRLRNTIEGKLYVNKCRNFVDEKYSFVEAWEIIEYCKTIGQDFVDYLGYSKEAASIGVLDFIVSNTDRHTQNYGFMMDNNTGKIVKLAPLFDFNCALISDVFDKNVSDTLSQMFNNEMTIRQVADFYRQYHKLVLDKNKFNNLKNNNKDYSYIFDKVLQRCDYIGVERR